MSARTPIRTCVGCAARAPQAKLLRVVAGSDGLRPDAERQAPGRGAYLHPSPDCWTAFARRGGPVRSLHLSVSRGERERLVATLAGGASAEAR